MAAAPQGSVLQGQPQGPSWRSVPAQLPWHWDLCASASAPRRSCLFAALAPLLGEKLLRFTRQMLLSESLSCWSSKGFSMTS